MRQKEEEEEEEMVVVVVVRTHCVIGISDRHSFFSLHGRSEHPLSAFGKQAGYTHKAAMISNYYRLKISHCPGEWSNGRYTRSITPVTSLLVAGRNYG
ncbi:hypothetical protein E2C01_005896 [Portunus trituberculatus]|uniref:Uncharacterized protein n=1 Tax=Portunus trituberculatus TaxID=210409 RepID=A0A5B7CWN8_PORTR|nr:hypothetical protein [Portunus trituberculatus]